MSPFAVDFRFVSSLDRADMFHVPVFLWHEDDLLIDFP